jgi:hypothetical protein
MSGGVQELTGWFNMQIARARIGLIAVAILHGDESRALDCHIEITVRRDLRAVRVIPAGGRVGGEDARCKARSGHRPALKGRHVRPKAGRVGVCEVMVVGSLGAQRLLCARHCHVKHLVHSALIRPSFLSRSTECR